MTRFERILSGENETRAAAASLGPLLLPGDLICLIGGLGAGKTTFTQGLARGLNLPPEAVHSPTFNIVFEHRDGRLPLFHFDVYRLSGPEALHDLAFDEYLEAEGVTVIEWADKIEEALPADRLDLRLKSNGGEARVLTVASGGARSETLANAWRETLE